jgi:hypothetical protein
LAIAGWEVPSRRSHALFYCKVLLHRAARGMRNRTTGLQRFLKAADDGCSVPIAVSRTSLWSDERPAERSYQLGKVQNLRRAAAALDGIVVPAGQVFSFWRQIGRASRRRGFVVGRMLQQGCLVPAVGGGLCQLSNALYDAALTAGCEIVERHAHSRTIPGSAAAAGRDATVAWNYVDLRFRSPRPLRMTVRLDHDHLVVRFSTPSQSVFAAAAGSGVVDATVSPRTVARTCATCGETACHRHESPTLSATAGHRTAFLVDENWPEFREFVAASRRSRDVLGLPLAGGRWRLTRYTWPTDGFDRVGAASLQSLARAWTVRRAPAQGAARRQAELTGSERIARRLAGLLSADIERVCVAQSLLPFLWRDGHLGGREVSVLMTRLPLGVLQARLDAAAAAWPERRTLADFRAPAWLVAAEAEALGYATEIITPHHEVAALFPEKASQLAWILPPTHRVGRGSTAGRRVAFPGPVVARKGAYEVREAALALGIEILSLGSELEGPDFWQGAAVRRPDPAAQATAWLENVAAVVQPVLVEERPRLLLLALAAGVPVIATAACGIAERPGLTIIPAGDVAALIAALLATLT